MTSALDPDAAAHRMGMNLDMVDTDVYDRAVGRFRNNNILLPTFAQLADPSLIPSEVKDRLEGIDPQGDDPLNLFRVHWYNRHDAPGFVGVPDHLVLTPEFTGVEAPIVLALGNRFPMIRAHKVLAAYACLAPRVVTGGFDPTNSRAIWPSTGNYARGGVAISRIMGCRGVAVLPEGMSRERFEWLDHWIEDPDDVIRTYGTESNVKEIYDACNELGKDPYNVIFNQFSEFWNHLGHYHVTGRALEHVFEDFGADHPGSRIAAFVSASGSAGTLGAGDYLKDRHGSRIVAVEALECPTMLANGFGEHNIQGIGDKHIPLIHNVMNTDIVIGISDKATDALGVMFNTPAGKSYLAEQVGCSEELVEGLVDLGLSSICNTLAAIKTAKYLDLGPDDVIMTVATDGSEMYGSERRAYLDAHHGDGYGPIDAAEAYGRHLADVNTSDLVELGETGRDRVFNLGYFTWVEQQGVEVPEFEARRSQSFWDGLRPWLTHLDERIEEFNRHTGMARS